MSKRRLKQQRASGGRRLKAPVDPPSLRGNHEHPAFSLQHLHSNYCISKCVTEDRLAFVERTLKLSSMTWQQIMVADRHGLGAEKISKNEIRQELPSHVTDDMPLLALRFSGMKPMIGFRENRIFCILFFDRDFTLYDHG